MAVLMLIPWNGPTLSAKESDAVKEQNNKDEYVQLVVSVLRSHVKALSQLTANKIKYSDNAARHANAIKETFDMLGPMDWHAAEARRLQKENKGNGTSMLSQKEFNEMVDVSMERIVRLRRAAHRWMRDNNRDIFMKELDSMMQSCKDCHALLPKNTAPAVWKGLRGKL